MTEKFLDNRIIMPHTSECKQIIRKFSSGGDHEQRNCCGVPEQGVPQQKGANQRGRLPQKVGARGLEPPTSRTRTVRATGLRYAPIMGTL